LLLQNKALVSYLFLEQRHTLHTVHREELQNHEMAMKNSLLLLRLANQGPVEF